VFNIINVKRTKSIEKVLKTCFTREWWVYIKHIKALKALKALINPLPKNLNFYVLKN